jgi:Uma2 family endonuclease
MSAGPRSAVSAAEYLEAERRSEFWSGVVVAMAGASVNHNRIVANWMRVLGNALAGGPCEPFCNDLRVKIEATESYVYPDVVVACNGGTYEDRARDVLLDPVFLVEVASPSTEAQDRDRKLRHYLQIPSLGAYAIVSQREAHVVLISKNDAGGWSLQTLFGLDARLVVPNIQIEIPLTAVYERVVFESEETDL